MSRVRANKITNKDASGAPLFTHGANITGVATATKFVGNVEGTLPATIGTGVTVTAAGIVSATSYYGDGSNLTGAGPTLANGSNDRVVTATGANALNGEANLTFNSSNILTATETGTGNGMGGISAATASAGGNAGYGFMTNSANRFALTTIGSAGAESLRIYDDNNNAERFRIGAAGQFGIGGANYGTSGQVLTSGGASAAPTWGTIAGAKIVRVYQGSTSSTISTNSTTYADVGLAETLTPLSSSNTFLIQFNFGVTRKTASTTASMYTRLIHSGGNVTLGSGYQLYYHQYTTDRGEPPAFWQFIHAPATTSSIEYKVQWKAENTSGSGFYLYGHRQMVIYELSGGVNT